MILLLSRVHVILSPNNLKNPFFCFEYLNKLILDIDKRNLESLTVNCLGLQTLFLGPLMMDPKKIIFIYPNLKCLIINKNCSCCKILIKRTRKESSSAEIVKKKD